MLTHFYDIESLANVFTNCVFRPEDNIIDVYYLADDPDLVSSKHFKDELLTRIHERNDNFDGDIMLFDLHQEPSARRMAKQFGLSDSALVNNPALESHYPADMRPVCDTDPDYDENVHPYLLGYNSYNYDTTMIALYLYETFPFVQLEGSKTKPAPRVMRFQPPTASLMRLHNDRLFDNFINNMPDYLTVDMNKKQWNINDKDWSDRRWLIRKAMLMSGRHIDVARLNEKQSRVGLKRLLGMLGHQILESDKLAQGDSEVKNADQLYDLIAYNVSDVVNLRNLFLHPVYQGQFELKRGLLQTYPELIYVQKGDEYAPDIKPERVRRDRLTIDSSSAQFATKALCPYGHLRDIPTVSFIYPSERMAAELGVKRVNVLEESKKFFYANFTGAEQRAAFDKVYNYYASIEGRNFNDSKNYADDYTKLDENNNAFIEHTATQLTSIPKDENCLFYYNADGSPSTCFVTFSTGGIHGAEYNKAMFDADTARWQAARDDMDYVRSVYPDPLNLRRAKVIEMPDGTERKYSDFIKSGATIKKMEATDPNKRASFYKDVDSQRPELFKRKDAGDTALNPKYVYTSCDLTNHEDFTSYYPNMLRMLSAFWNEGLGYDRYAEIFENKQKFGKLMKDKSLPQEERERYAVLREGTKLILNSASGAGDTTWESPIRLNNLIISMRIIGQLFSWRIGQAQTIAGARITSTNTDGLYSVLESTLNNQVLERESKSIGVEIEPEPTYLISKDANNRLEMDPNTGIIQSASGGSLACRANTNPTKSLAHPAIIDWALAEYLICVSLGIKTSDATMTSEFDDALGMRILKSAMHKFEAEHDANKLKEPAHVHWMKMFGNVIASSTGSINYIFGTRDAQPGRPIILQHYNRVYIMRDASPETMHLHAANAKVITAAMKAKRRREHTRDQQHDSTALDVLRGNGVNVQALPSDKEAVVKKVSNIEPDWNMLVCNRNLFSMTREEVDDVIAHIDMDAYLSLLRDMFERNWRNHMPDDASVDESHDDDGE